MNRIELTREIAERMSVTQTEAKRFISVWQEVIEDAIKEDKSVMLQGFGTFSPWKQSQRLGRNPKTGVPVMIACRNNLKFKAGKCLLSYLNDRNKEENK